MGTRAIMQCCLAMLISIASYATETVETKSFAPADSTYANWVFSGEVINEAGENYDYLFQMQRQGQAFHATVAVFDAQTKTVLMSEESHATITDPTYFNWQVGRAFLRFNPITASWIFGLNDQNKQGFNFKVDMLKQVEHDPVAQDLRRGVEFMVSQTGQLNGHVHIGQNNEEQFVTGKTAWFRQIWLVDQQDKNHQLNSLLCQFNDGSGFYSMNTLEADTLRSTIAGAFNAEGAPTAVSQFINIKQAEKDGLWHIQVASPHLDLILANLLKQDTLVAGYVSEKNKQGFCMLSKEQMGEQKLAG